MPNNAYSRPKGKKKQTPLEPKSKKFLADLGFIVGKTSWWQYTNFGFQVDQRERTFTPRRYSGVRMDLFGFVDAIAFKPTHVGTLYVQITSVANCSSRKVKALNANSVDYNGRKRMILYELLNSGNRFQIHSWKKDEETRRWKLRIHEAYLEMGLIEWKISWPDMRLASKGILKDEEDERRGNSQADIG